MGVIVTKENSKSTSLNDRISAELRSKAVATEFLNEDGTTALAKKTKKTTKFSWFWLVLIVLAIISGSFIVLF